MTRLRRLLDKKTLTVEEKAEVSKLFLAMAQHENQLEDDPCRGIHRITTAELEWRRGLQAYADRQGWQGFIVEFITAWFFIGLLTYAMACLNDLVRYLRQ